MFTSRAEYRLSLRQDNADIRLTRKGIEAGIVSAERQECLKQREGEVDRCIDLLTSVSLPRTVWASYGEAFQMRQKDGKHKNAVEVLSMPDIGLDDIIRIVKETGSKQEPVNDSWKDFEVKNLVYDTVEAICKYSNYLSRQEDEMERWRKSASLQLPADIVYSHEYFPAFSSEELEKLRTHRPATLHMASQIQGVTPHALIYLANYITRGRHHKKKDDMISDFSPSAGEAFVEKHYEEIE
jgi:tRNA uridine 5-carboxymethylaminomethyl modification enzyme